MEVDLRRSNVPGGIISQFVSIKQSEVDMKKQIDGIMYDDSKHRANGNPVCPAVIKIKTMKSL